MPLMVLCPAATVEKIVKDVLPKDIRLASNALDLLLECCGGERHSLALVRMGPPVCWLRGRLSNAS